MSVPERSALAWRKSSYSDEEEDCVEVAHTSGAALVRDSKNVQAGSLRFSRPAWHTLLDHLTTR